MLKLQLFKAFSLFFLIFITNFAIAQRAYLVKDIPDPKKNGGGYVSDPDKILGSSAVAELNTTIADFERKTHVQVAVVVVNDFDHNKEDFDFAYELFNTWGIGQKKSNNGLLLFISKERRKYRFITGTGAEGVLPDVKLKHIAERQLLPAFRKNDYATGIVNTINALGELILNPNNQAELNQLFTQKDNSNSLLESFWLPTAVIILAFFGVFRLVNRQGKNLPFKTFTGKNPGEQAIAKGCAGVILFIFIAVFAFIFFDGTQLFDHFGWQHVPLILYAVLAIALYFRYLFYISSLRQAHNDDQNFFTSVSSFNKKNFWLVIFSPLILISFIAYLFKKSKNNDRFKPVMDSKNKEMVRVDRDINVDGSPFLTKGQRKEEVLQAYDYDIWESTDHTEHLVKQWPAEAYKQYTECPDCYFRTFKLHKQVTTRAATYSHSGQAKVINECSFCKKTEFIKWIILPMLVESSSSSSSSGGSSSSSSSSSSSWGGGSSSGGGTGGSW